MAAACNGGTVPGVKEKRHSCSVCEVPGAEGRTCTPSRSLRRFRSPSAKAHGSTQTMPGRKDGVVPTARNDVTDDGCPKLSHIEKDKGWAWVVAFAVMANTLIAVGSYRSLSVLIVELMGVYDEPAAKFGFILFWFGIGFSVSALINIAGIGEIFHERALVVISGVVFFAGFMCAYFSSMLKHIYLLGFCIGVATQLGTAAGFHLVGQYFEKRLALANGIADSGVSLGTLVFPPTLQVLFAEFSYRGSCLIMAAVVLNLFVIGGFLRPTENRIKTGPHGERENGAKSMPETNISKSNLFETKNASKESQQSVVNIQSPEVSTKTGFNNSAFTGDFELEIVCSDEATGRRNTYSVTDTKVGHKSSLSSSISALKKFSIKGCDCINEGEKSSGLKSVFTGLVYFKDPAFTLFQVSFFTATLSSECLVQFYPAFVDDQGISKEQNTYLLTLIGACDLVSRVVTGCLGDCMSRSLLVIIAQTTLGGACFLSMFATSFWPQVAFSTAIGLLYGVNYTFRTVILIDYFGLPDLSRTLGISNLLSGLGFLSGGPVVGFLRDFTGSYTVAIQLLGGCFFFSALCMVAAMLVRRCRNRRTSKSRS